MRRRLTLALVGLVAGSLLVAGAGALLVTRYTARTQATHQLVQQGEVLAHAARKVSTPLVLRTIARMLRFEDAEIIAIGPQGRLLRPLTAGLPTVQLHPRRLLAGKPVSGWRGTLAFAAVPLRLASSFRVPAGGTAAVILTRRVGTLASGWIYLVLVGGGTLVAAAIVATQLSRRITRPVLEASVATGKIAGGDLGARIEPAPGGFAELDSLAISINAMAAGLSDARQRESQLLLSVSHDLRTPLTSIRGYAEAIEEGVTEDVAAAARIIGAESRRLERLVSDLLDLAKLQTAHLSLHLGAVDALAVTRGAVESFAPLATAREIAVGFNPVGDGGGGGAWADGDRLAQVVGNLLQNAIEFARSTVTLSVGSRRAPDQEGTVSIVVEDDGPGIPAQDLSRVFDRFYQVDRGAAARQRGGSGLGLSIVAELVRAMGGTVHAESPVTATGGARMVVRLKASSLPTPTGRTN